MVEKSWDIQSFFALIGGLSLFLFGMRYASEGLRSWAGNRLRIALARLTRNRYIGLVVGMAATVATQSSSATTVMLVGFVNAGLMAFRQTLGIILGADIGTTLTVQLIAFRLSDYALLIIFVGFIFMVLSKGQADKSLGQAIMAFGFIFFGMKVMSDSMIPLKSSQQAMRLFASVGEQPFMGIVIATVFTAIIQSSAATIGLALTLSFQGLIDLSGAIPLILGANVGTCATALLASLGTSGEARRVAWAHILFKLLGVAIFLPFLGPFAGMISITSGNLARQIANAHTFFNVAMALIFLPFIGIYARLVEKIVPAEIEKREEFVPEYLDSRVLDTPALAIGQATREILRVGDVVYIMLRDAITVFRNNDDDLRTHLIKEDDKVDLLQESIMGYLTRLSQKELTSEQSQREMILLKIVDEFEHIGDLISKSLMVYAKKKIEQAFWFSDEGFREIRCYHAQTLETLQMAINAVATFDRALARRTIDRTKTMVDEQRRLHRNHIGRLHRGLKESLDTSTIHLDLISDLNSINLHSSYIGYAILEMT